MEKIKPYMFWVVCGVILVILLLLAISLEPVNEKGQSVVKAKSTLDSKVKAFGKYVSKAERRAPDQFEIDNVSYFKKLEDEYLVSKAWMPGLEKVQGQLAEHKDNVEKDLAKRSEVLYKKVCDIPNANRFRWYQDYNEKTIALLDELYKAEQLVLSASNPLSIAKEKEDIQDALKTSKQVRDAAGFHTYSTGGEYPSTEEQEIISIRFRISEAIVKAVMAAEGSLIENNMIKFNDVNFVTPPEGIVKPQLMKIKWDNHSWDGINKKEIKGGSAIPFRVHLRGSVSALLSATAQIENSQEPIFVVYGSTWSQPKSLKGEVVREMDRPMDLELRIAVLDYHGGQQ